MPNMHTTQCIFIVPVTHMPHTVFDDTQTYTRLTMRNGHIRL